MAYSTERILAWKKSTQEKLQKILDKEKIELQKIIQQEMMSGDRLIEGMGVAFIETINGNKPNEEGYYDENDEWITKAGTENYEEFESELSAMCYDYIDLDCCPDEFTKP